MTARVWLGGPGGGQLTAALVGPDGAEIARTETQAAGGTAEVAFDELTGIRLWQPDDPALYRLDLTLEDEGDADTPDRAVRLSRGAVHAGRVRAERRSR